MIPPQIEGKLCEKRIFLTEFYPKGAASEPKAQDEITIPK
jgi:hypothetical protein|tara:strand:- start:709 stop:828 length:120 start_codon:yes stop_codon:yes gene_type:complete